MGNMENKAFKEALACICKANCGIFDDLERAIDHRYIYAFETVGFITRGYSKTIKTWRKTKLADQYFRETYGSIAFLFLKLGL